MLNLENELSKLSYYEDVIKSYKDNGRQIDLGLSIRELMEELKDGYEFDKPTMAKIPKSTGGLREVFVFNDKDSFVLRLINKILMDNFSDQLHPNAFAYRKGVRTFNAAKHLQSVLKEDECFGVKLDIKSYFTSVNHEYLVDEINNLVEDEVGKNLLLNLFSINSYVDLDGIVNEDLGIMPGSALSSFFANWVLKDVDEVFSERCLVYARYSDDLVMFCKSKEDLSNCISLMESMLGKKGLRINQSKFKWYNNPNVVDDFLGMDVYKNKIGVSLRGRKAIKKLIKSICKRQRLLFEKSQNKVNLNLYYLDKDLLGFDLSNLDSSVHRTEKDFSLHYVKKAISVINRKLYKSIFYSGERRKSNRISYMFANTTTNEFFRELDFYTLDCLRFVYSGKWNKGSVKELGTKKLESLGFISSVKMYNIYRMDRDVYLNQVSLMGRKSNSEIDYQYNFDFVPKSDFKDFVDIVGDVSFINMFYKMIECDGKFLVKDEYRHDSCQDTYFILNTNHVVFDVPNNKVFFIIPNEGRKIDVFDEDRFVLNDLRVLINDTPMIIRDRINLFNESNRNSLNEDTLLMLGIRASFKSAKRLNSCLGHLDDYVDSDFGLDKRVVYNDYFFRNYSIEEICNNILSNSNLKECSKILNSTESYNNRLLKFNAYLYCFLIASKQHFLMDKRKFIKIKSSNINGFNLILNKEWF